MEIVIIGAVRVLGSLPVLRWAFVGAIIALVVGNAAPLPLCYDGAVNTYRA